MVRPERQEVRLDVRRDRHGLAGPGALQHTRDRYFKKTEIEKKKSLFVCDKYELKNECVSVPY
jgi:hypothetical protein